MEKEEITTNDYLKGIVLNLPDSPGIYQYLNSEGTIIYVGKAKNLKRRVSSYFNREHPNGKTRLPVSIANASINIDFPAPVSPVKTLAPVVKSIIVSSIIAKLMICKF